MLKKVYLYYSFLCSVCLFAAISGHSWEYEQTSVMEGVLRRAERRRITRDSDGTEIVKIEKSVVLVTDEPLVLSHSVALGKQQIASTEIAHSHIEVFLAKEFMPLIGKRVQCSGHFIRPFDPFADGVVLDVDTVLDCELLAHQLKTVFYEPEEVELSGMLYEMVYPGPPEYMSVEEGDYPEEVVILTLKDPINVRVAQDDDFNEPEQGVRELQVVFTGSMPLARQMKGEITLKGTLYHAHTGHHRRRVLMMVTSWKRQIQIPYAPSENDSPVTLRGFPDDFTRFFRIFSAIDSNQREFSGGNLSQHPISLRGKSSSG